MTKTQIIKEMQKINAMVYDVRTDADEAGERYSRLEDMLADRCDTPIEWQDLMDENGL